MRKRINTYMKTRKAAKILIKRAKENPDLYTEQEVEYAKNCKGRSYKFNI